MKLATMLERIWAKRHDVTEDSNSTSSAVSCSSFTLSRRNPRTELVYSWRSPPTLSIEHIVVRLTLSNLLLVVISNRPFRAIPLWKALRMAQL